MDHFTRLIEQLPPDRRVEAALVLENLSNDPNSVSYAIYSEILHALDVKFAERLATTDAKVQQLATQQAKGHAENLKSVKQEIGALNRDSYWHSIISSKIIGAIIWTVCVMASSIAIQNIFLQRELSPLQEIISAHREALESINNDPESLVAFTKYTSEANEDALQIAESLHSINKLMALPKMQMYRGDDGYLIIYGPKSSMPVGTTEDGRNWVKLANPVARVSPDTTPSIDKAKEAEKRVKKSK